MTFPMGRSVLAMILCSLLGGGAIWLRRSPERADLTLWIFADLHARMYRGNAASPSLLEEFQRRTGKSVRMDLIAAPALDVRLLSLFMFAQGDGTQADSASPDVVEVPMTSIGKYLRPPVADVGFLPLNSFLAGSGIVPSRFTPWSKDGQIFGVPHDLHPCSLSYRKDLFDLAGVGLESAVTWDDLQQRCLRFQQYWREQGRPRNALALSTTGPDMLMVMLRQQHVELVDADLSLHLTNPKVAKTLCWYAQAVAGPGQIGVDLNPAPGQASADLAAGDTCGLITPDWLIADLKHYSPDLSGKLHMMPLPRFSPEDARTASLGGTMIGITRTCQNPKLAWKLIQTLYLDPVAIRIGKRASGILPPIPRYWSDPIFHQSDPFFAGQKIDELYIELAGELPEVRMTAYSAAAQTFLTIALNRAVNQVRAGKTADLQGACEHWLQDAQSHVAAMIRFDR